MTLKVSNKANQWNRKYKKDRENYMKPKTGLMRRLIKINKPLAVCSEKKREDTNCHERGGITALHPYIYLH